MVPAAGDRGPLGRFGEALADAERLLSLGSGGVAGSGGVVKASKISQYHEVLASKILLEMRKMAGDLVTEAANGEGVGLVGYGSSGIEGRGWYGVSGVGVG